MATAPQERNKTHFYRYEEIPIIWYLTSCTVAMQGELMYKALLDHIYKDAKLSAVDIIWIPCSGIPDLMRLPRDVYEVVDAIEKCKEVGIKYKVSVKISLATSWLPRGDINHEAALRVYSMNRALLVLGYYFLRCRVTDLITSTLHEVRGKDKDDTMEIRDLEEFKFVHDMYTHQHGGMEIDEHAGRQIREILRRVFLKYGCEPNWESATNSQGRFYRIPEPRVTFNGRSRRLPEPTSGRIPAYEVVRERAEIRQRYVAGDSDDRELPPTYLEQYPWQYVLARSNRPDYVQPELVSLQQYPLSKGNRIFDEEVSTLARPVKVPEHDHQTLVTAYTASADKPTSVSSPAVTAKPTSASSPADKGTIIVTKIFAASRQSRTPAMQRLGPKVRTASEPATRSRSSPRPRREEEEKGEPTKTSRKRAALRDDLSADKSSEEDMVMDVVEPADKSSEECEVVDMIEAPANKSLEDEVLQPVVQTKEILDVVEPAVIPTDSSDEDEADNFRQLLADLTERFEKQQQQRRAKKQQRAASKQGDK